MVQWLALTMLNHWLAPERDLSQPPTPRMPVPSATFWGMLTASTSLWYLYALIVYFILCKLFSRWALPLLVLFVLLSAAVNFSRRRGGE